MLLLVLGDTGAGIHTGRRPETSRRLHVGVLGVAHGHGLLVVVVVDAFSLLLFLVDEVPLFFH